jgi:Ca-activated chloride channel family protein
VRYGIITPYTSFLIDETDILTQGGMDRAAQELEASSAGFNSNNTGSRAVDDADMMNNMNMAEAPAAPMMMMPTQTAGTMNTQQIDGEFAQSAPMQNAITNVSDKTFINLNGVWNDTTFQPDTMETVKVEFLSDAYFDLLAEMPELADYFALGDAVIVVIDGVAYEVVALEA